MVVIAIRNYLINAMQAPKLHQPRLGNISVTSYSRRRIASLRRPSASQDCYNKYLAMDKVLRHERMVKNFWETFVGVPQPL